MINVKKKALRTILVALTLFTTSASALIINLNQVDPSQFSDTEGQAALNGFDAAASFWEGILGDDVTLNFDIGFSSLAPGVIGGASATESLFFYQNVLNGFMGDITSDVDLIAASNFVCEDPGAGACAFSFLDEELDTNGDLQTELDSGTGFDNIGMSLTQANAKALGFAGDDTGGVFGNSTDASITFSSDSEFDFDRSDGIDADKFDFIGIAIHEIGHALGFVSGVDIYDEVNYSNPAGPLRDLDNSFNASTLDLFRYSAESLAAGAGVLDFRPGANSYFSIDGGQTEIAKFSTGVNGGDGSQASHWKDNLGLGLLDPTASFGELLQFTSLDFLAFDAIGWDIRASAPTPVPAPGSILLFALFGAITLFRTRNA